MLLALCVAGMPGSIIGMSSNDSLSKAMGIFNAFGTVVFAFSFSMILIEIQARQTGRWLGWVGEGEGWVVDFRLS